MAQCCTFIKKKMKVIFLVVISCYAITIAIYSASNSTSSYVPPVQQEPTIALSNNIIRSNLKHISPLQPSNDSAIFKLPSKKYKPEIVQHYKSMESNEKLKKKCSSCAIVSSSGQMLNTGAGEIIDNASCVIRMNHSPVKQYQNDVGSRTTVRVVCHMSTTNVMANIDILEGVGTPETIILFGLNAKNHKWAKLKAEILKEQFPNIDFYSLDKNGELMADVIFELETGKNRMESNTWLSTGWYTILTALDMCEKIDIYGFVYENYCREHPHENTKYHYSQSFDSPGECDYYHSHENATLFGGHRFLTEKAVFNRWAYLYNITFHYPLWNINRTSEPPVVNTPWIKRVEKTSWSVDIFQKIAKWAFGTMY
ncbi:alpha-N-acetylgalactosaminide alpha-2,6-sialyltransferase 5-like isoform X2 [Antedon mediterranea]|uniref:alpha-N-acetylgalactosaminide alpha-2,6-sialyltransferase 5-like isoform X2 n=1 Tax=Antedon mediterranea TaxID=105859 RepID=UPI003AF8DFC2